MMLIPTCKKHGHAEGECIFCIREERDALLLQVGELQKELTAQKEDLWNQIKIFKDDNVKLYGENCEALDALEIAKAGTIHVLSGHVYGADDKLVAFVDGCARCRVEKVLGKK